MGFKTKFGLRDCEHCGKQFEKLMPRQRFCCFACRMARRSKVLAERKRARRKSKRRAMWAPLIKLRDIRAELLSARPDREQIAVERCADPIDDIASNIAREAAARTINYQGVLIRDIDAAIARCLDGTYGTCEECGKPIGSVRLAAVPWAPLCRGCQKVKAMPEGKPKVITLCGSSRFVDIMAVCAWLLERDEGAITMGLHLLPRWYTNVNNHIAEAQGCATSMDELHLRKIDMSDEIFVVNAQDYIGESTRREIAYAESHGKPIRWFTHDQIGQAIIALFSKSLRVH